MSTLTDFAGQPDLPAGEVMLEPTTTGWLLRIGRATRRPKNVNMSAAVAESVMELLNAKLPKPTTTRTRKPKAATS